MKRNKPRRGRPPKVNALNTNLNLRMLPPDRAAIEKVSQMMGMSLNKFVCESAKSIIGMINGTESDIPQMVQVGRYLREQGIHMGGR